MPHTESFFVRSSDNKVKYTSEPLREYFIKGGRKEGQAKYLIEVFGYNHEKVAKKIQQVIKDAGLDDCFFKIRVETNDNMDKKINE